jgi:hypothetical protein
MDADANSHRQSAEPARGSPEWSVQVSKLMDRNQPDDFDELCRLMGIDDPATKAAAQGRRPFLWMAIAILIAMSAGVYLALNL